MKDFGGKLWVLTAVAVVAGCLLGAVASHYAKTAADENSVMNASGAESRDALAQLRFVRAEEYIESRVHPGIVAAGMALFSSLGLAMFPGRVKASQRE